MPKQNLQEKADILFESMFRHYDPYSKADIRNVKACVGLYGKIMEKAEKDEDANTYIECENRIRELNRLREKIIIKDPSLH